MSLMAKIFYSSYVITVAQILSASDMICYREILYLSITMCRQDKEMALVVFTAGENLG